MGNFTKDVRQYTFSGQFRGDGLFKPRAYEGKFYSPDEFIKRYYSRFLGGGNDGQAQRML